MRQEWIADKADDAAAIEAANDPTTKQAVEPEIWEQMRTEWLRDKASDEEAKGAA